MRDLSKINGKNIYMYMVVVNPIILAIKSSISGLITIINFKDCKFELKNKIQVHSVETETFLYLKVKIKVYPLLTIFFLNMLNLLNLLSFHRYFLGNNTFYEGFAYKIYITRKL